MNMRLWGAMMIIVGFTAIGALLSYHYRKELKNIQDFIEALNNMECELQYRFLPLPALLQKICQNKSGEIFIFLQTLSEELQSQVQPDVSSCVTAALQRHQVSGEITKLIEKFGRSLGQYSASGQLLEIQAIRKDVEDHKTFLRTNQKKKVKNYQTLSICVGAAIAIILL